MWQRMTTIDRPMIQYVRQGKNNTKNGLLLSGILDREVCVGWSLCNKKDDFDLNVAVFIAEERCYVQDRFEKYMLEDIDDKYVEFKDDDPCIELIDDIIPKSIHKDLFYFLDRINRYYKETPKSKVLSYLNKYL